MSIAGGVDRALERGASIGCASVQIFLKGNMQWHSRLYASDEIYRYRDRLNDTGITTVFAHSSYLINPATPNTIMRKKSVAAIIDEIERATTLGIPFIVMHPGSHMGKGEKTGLDRAAKCLDEAFHATRCSPVKIALETTAGQGTCLGYRFEHLAKIIDTSRFPKRLAVCIDTCHLFAAGYDIRTKLGYEQTMKQIDTTIGSHQVVAFHLNDSKKMLGSRVDRHDHIGKGFIGLDAFHSVLSDIRWCGIPMVLETPKGENMREDVQNLGVLRSLLVNR